MFYLSRGMSSRPVSFYTLLLTIFAACSPTTTTTPCSSIPEGAQRLIEAYPDHILGYENNMILFHDGSRIIYDDGKERTTEEILREQDIEDTFLQEYNTNIMPPPYGYDPGRYRSATLFSKIYGDTREDVSKNLVYVEWCPTLGGKPVLFSKTAGAAEALSLVSKELDKHPELKAWVLDALTFNWRTIHSTNRLSPHSYGIAIDLEPQRSNYWKWSYPRAEESAEIEYRNSFDMRVVEIFERHGFIWGGRWYHFDTMHFEYRPELNPTK